MRVKAVISIIIAAVFIILSCKKQQNISGAAPEPVVTYTKTITSTATYCTGTITPTCTMTRTCTFTSTPTMKIYTTASFTTVAQAADGNYVITGQTGMYIPINLAFIKTDTAGNEIFSKEYQVGKASSGYGILPLSDGNYIIAGSANKATNDNDPFIIKVDAAGDCVWVKAFESPLMDEIYQVCESGDGGFVMAGRTDSFGAGGFDAYAIKVDSNGDCVWAKTWGTSSYDYASAVMKTTDNNLLIAGIHNGDLMSLKIDSAGNQLWLKKYDFGGEERFSAINSTSDNGNVFIAIDTALYGKVSILKTDSSGNQQWLSVINRTNPNERYTGIYESGDGGYMLIGDSEYYGTTGFDVFVVKLDSGGNFVWSKHYGDTAGEIVLGSTKTSTGQYLAVGRTTVLFFNAYMMKLDYNGDRVW